MGKLYAYGYSPGRLFFRRNTSDGGWTQTHARAFDGGPASWFANSVACGCNDQPSGILVWVWVPAPSLVLPLKTWEGKPWASSVVSVLSAPPSILSSSPSHSPRLVCFDLSVYSRTDRSCCKTWVERTGKGLCPARYQYFLFDRRWVSQLKRVFHFMPVLSCNIVLYVQ